MSKYYKLHHQLKMAMLCEMALFWNERTKKYYALPMHIGVEEKLELIKSFEKDKTK